jgi:hypothetical protein
VDGQAIDGPVSRNKFQLYNFVWDSTTVANGKHDLTITGHDATGNTGTSGIYSIFVSNSILVDTAPPAAITDLRAVPG